MATAHKMLRDSQPHRDSEVDYEQLPVKGNAPRWLRKLKR